MSQGRVEKRRLLDFLGANFRDEQTSPGTVLELKLLENPIKTLTLSPNGG